MQSLQLITLLKIINSSDLLNELNENDTGLVIYNNVFQEFIYPSLYKLKRIIASYIIAKTYRTYQLKKLIRHVTNGNYYSNLYKGIFKIEIQRGITHGLIFIGKTCDIVYEIIYEHNSSSIFLTKLA